MNDAYVKDLNEIRVFRNSVNEFGYEYCKTLSQVESSATTDSATIKAFRAQLEENVNVAERNYHAAQQELDDYISTNSGRDSKGNERHPNPSVVSQLQRAVSKAQTILDKTRINQEKGASEIARGESLVNNIMQTARSAKNRVNNETIAFSNSINRALEHLERYAQ